MTKRAPGPVDLRKIAATSGIHKDMRELVREVADYGWHGKRSGKGGITVVSPDGDASFYVHLSTRDPGRVAKDARKTIDDWTVRTVQEDFAEKGVTVDGVSGIHPTARCKDHDIEFVSWEGLSEHIRAEHTPEPEATDDQNVREHKEETMDRLDEAIARGEAALNNVRIPEAASKSGTMSTSETVKPWLAIMTRHKDGTVDLYESEAVLEVETEGGTIFRCSLDGCGYEAPMPRSVRTHYAGHVRSGEVPPVKAERVVVETQAAPRRYARKEGLREGLSREIYVAMRARRQRKGESMSAWCNALTDIIITNRAAAGVDTEAVSEGIDPSRAEATIQTIRELVGGGNADRLSALEEALAVERAAREEAESKAAALRENLGTLRDLLPSLEE